MLQGVTAMPVRCGGEMLKPCFSGVFLLSCEMVSLFEYNRVEICLPVHKMTSKNTNILSIWILTRAGEKTRNTIPYWVAHPFMHYTPPPWLLGFMTDGTPYTDLRGLDNFVVSWSQHRNVKFCDFHGQVFHTSTKCTVCRQPFGNCVLSSLVSQPECHIWPWWPTLKLPCPNKCYWT